MTAKPAQPFYRRNLPHMQCDGCTIFVTFRAIRGLVLPESVRAPVLTHCLHDHGKKLAMQCAIVMPDHVHQIFTPLEDESGNPYGLAEIMQAIKGASAHTANKLLGRRGHVWQDESFDHVLRRDESLIARCEYLLLNPVRKKLVQRWQDYPWLWVDPSLLGELFQDVVPEPPRP
jgi:REP element-mobilizing transposase RayT